ncbi:hypothetical protein [Pedobacter sp. BS3]|nr:hypothetical protein [Pedobacter sp. BS3]
MKTLTWELIGQICAGAFVLFCAGSIYCAYLFKEYIRKGGKL